MVLIALNLFLQNATLANVVFAIILIAVPHTLVLFIPAEIAVVPFAASRELAKMSCRYANRVIRKFLLPTIFTTIEVTFLATEKIHLLCLLLRS